MRLTTKTLVATAVAALLLAPLAAAIPSSGITKNYWTPTVSGYGHLVCGQEDDPGAAALDLVGEAPEGHGIGGACFDVSGTTGTIELTAQDHADDPPNDLESQHYDWVVGGYYHLDTPGEVTEAETPADPVLDRTNFDLVNHLDPQAPNDPTEPDNTRVTDDEKDWHIFCTHGRDIANAEGTPVTIDVSNVDTLKVRVDTLYPSMVQCEGYHDIHRSPVAHLDNPVDSLANGDPVGTPPTSGTITVAPSN